MQEWPACPWGWTRGGAHEGSLEVMDTSGFKWRRDR